MNRSDSLTNGGGRERGSTLCAMEALALARRQCQRRLGLESPCDLPQAEIPISYHGAIHYR